MYLNCRFTRRDSVASCAVTALKLSVEDSKRTQALPSELTELMFRIRCRSDGPLRDLCPIDPWWKGLGSGRVSFGSESDDNVLTFTWPKGPDGTEMNRENGRVAKRRAEKTRSILLSDTVNTNFLETPLLSSQPLSPWASGTRTR